jgi:hypothetical protein
MNYAPSKKATPNPSKQDDGDTIPAPEQSLRVGERLKYVESETSEAWLEGDETKTVP